MNNTLEQLKTILDNGGTIEKKGSAEITLKDGYYYYQDTNGTIAVRPTLDDMMNNPSDWQEVKKEIEYHIPDVPEFEHNPSQKKFEVVFAPRMIVMDPKELEAMEKELKELRAKVDKPLCHSCREETFWGLPYCENCHNEIIGMS